MFSCIIEMQLSPVEMHHLQCPADIHPELIQIPRIVHLDLQAEETPPIPGKPGRLRHIPKPAVDLVRGQILQVAQFSDDDERPHAQDDQKQAGHHVLEIDQEDRDKAEYTGDAVDSQDCLVRVEPHLDQAVMDVPLVRMEYPPP